MRHADESMSDLYDKIEEDVEFRRIWAGRCGVGFELPSVVPNVSKIGARDAAEKSLKSFLKMRERLVRKRGFEPPTPGPEPDFSTC